MKQFINKSTYTVFFAVIIAGVFMLASCTTTKDAVSPVEGEAPLTTECVRVSGGDIQGIISDDGTVEIYAGIPFAAPPVGDLRWKEPEDVIPWEGIYKADHFPPMAMQTQNSAFFNFLMNLYTHQDTSRTYKAAMSEDCLYLNVWKPVGAEKMEEKLPVLVYIHGGSLMSGQNWHEHFDGEALSKQGIIVVTLAYRLGVFGYFADEALAAESPHGTTGNYGLLDQIKGLEWVQENIASFGGDAGNVTIAGESAGSSSVNALCASPLAKGLFRRAIAESSSIVQETPPHTFRTMEAALEMGEDIKKEFKATSIEEMRAIPAEKLIKTDYANNSMTVDGYALPDTPYQIYKNGQNNEEALLNGFNKREGFGFAFFTHVTKGNIADLLRPSFKDRTEEFLEKHPVKSNKEAKALYTDIFSVVCFTYPHDCWTAFMREQGRPVWEYYFSRENGSVGTNHSGEIIYAYHNVPENDRYSERDYELEEIMSSYWLNFIKTGNPNGSDSKGKPLPEWEESSECGGLVMELGDQCLMREDPFSYAYEYLE
ncbi:MAG: carboxylesterase family protein [Treponemataceae bacterium]|nr:carboxylesterase family protein [Treponemataceae bacterium]